jgi:Zn-finger nucleic acid-binding protein
MNIQERLKDEKFIYCPKCSTTKKKVEMSKLISPNQKYIVDECPKCKGRFLDKDELNVMGKMSFIEYIQLWFKRKR